MENKNYEKLIGLPFFKNMILTILNWSGPGSIKCVNQQKVGRVQTLRADKAFGKEK